jgi:hypothetical protein
MMDTGSLDKSKIEPVAVSVPRAAEAIDHSVRGTWDLIKTGRLGSKRAGRRVIVPVSAIHEYIASLPSAANSR